MRKKPKKPIPSEKRLDRFLEHPAFELALLVVLTIVCFYPLMRYFFAQDDFILMFKSGYEGRDFFLGFFERSPGQFRPLSKVLYFWLTYNLFGLNPLPYHIISLLIHILNTLLLYKLMTRLRISHAAAFIVSTLFALNVSFLNVVGWISCIQQLLGELFVLLALLFGINVLEKPNWRSRIISFFAYLLALMSAEQTYAVPILIFLYAYLNMPSLPQGKRIIKSLKDSTPSSILLGLYVIFILFWKRVPGEGAYDFHLGTNVVANLLTYLDRIFHFSLLFPFLINRADAGLTFTHLLFLMLVIYNVARGRGKQTLFALAFYLLTILPLLFLTLHTYYTHLYIPSFGVLYLLAFVVEDFLKALAEWKKSAFNYSPLLFLLILSIICYTKVRENELSSPYSKLLLPDNFVLRRAIMAKNLLVDIEQKDTEKLQHKEIFMISLSGKETWFSKNVIAAIGGDHALKLLYRDPDLKVHLLDVNTVPKERPRDSLLFFYDDIGHCFTAEEFTGQPNRPSPGQAGNGE